MSPRTSTIRVDVANLPAVRDFIERVQDVAVLPGDPTDWDAHAMAELLDEALEDLFAAVGGAA